MPGSILFSSIVSVMVLVVFAALVGLCMTGKKTISIEEVSISSLRKSMSFLALKLVFANINMHFPV